MIISGIELATSYFTYILEFIYHLPGNVVIWLFSLLVDDTTHQFEPLTLIHGNLAGCISLGIWVFFLDLDFTPSSTPAYSSTNLVKKEVIKKYIEINQDDRRKIIVLDCYHKRRAADKPTQI